MYGILGVSFVIVLDESIHRTVSSVFDVTSQYLAVSFEHALNVFGRHVPVEIADVELVSWHLYVCVYSSPYSASACVYE